MSRKVEKNSRRDSIIRAVTKHMKVPPYVKLIRLQQAREFFDKFTPKEAKEFHRKFREGLL